MKKSYNMDFELDSQSLPGSQLSVSNSMESSQTCKNYGEIYEIAKQLRHARSEQKKIISTLKLLDGSLSSVDILKKKLTSVQDLLATIHRALAIEKKKIKEEHLQLTESSSSSNDDKKVKKIACQILHQQKTLVVLYKIQKQLGAKIKSIEETRFASEEVLDFNFQADSGNKSIEEKFPPKVIISQGPLSIEKNIAPPVNRISIEGQLSTEKKFAREKIASSQQVSPVKIISSQGPFSIEKNIAPVKTVNFKGPSAIKKKFVPPVKMVDLQEPLKSIEKKLTPPVEMIISQAPLLASLPGSKSSANICLKDSFISTQNQRNELKKCNNAVKRNDLLIQFNESDEEEDDGIPDTQKTQSLIQYLLHGKKKEREEVAYLGTTTPLPLPCNSAKETCKNNTNAHSFSKSTSPDRNTHKNTKALSCLRELPYSENSTKRQISDNENFNSSVDLSFHCSPKVIVPYSMDEFVDVRKSFLPKNFWEDAGFKSVTLNEAFLQQIGLD